MITGRNLTRKTSNFQSFNSNIVNMKETYSSIVQKIGNQSYVKEINLESDKLFFYYNNKAKAEGGGVFVYRVSKDVQRPDKQTQLYNYLAEGVTSAFSGVPNYTLDLHRTLFDSKNKLF